MSNLEAIHSINNILNDLPAGSTISKKDLARRTGIHPRTIERHLDFLRTALGAPLVCSMGASAYRYDLEDGDRFELPGIWFSKDELAALFAIKQVLGDIPEGALSKIADALWKRIERVSVESGQLPDNGWTKKVKVLPIGGRMVSDDVFRTTVDGLVHGKRLQITQKTLGKATVSREVSPLQIVRYRDNWYLDAWCHLREEFRSFGLSRIHDARTLDSKVVKKAPTALRDHFASAYGIFNGPADKVATIRFSGIAAEEVSKERWHSAQTGRNMGDGIYELDVPYHKDTELVMDILRWGELAVVIEPQDLREKVRNILESARKLY